MATAQNGWPASASKAAIGIDSDFNVNGVRFPGGIKSGDVAIVLGYVAHEFHHRVEPLVAGWCWGYAYRAVRGGSSTSNHAAGCAIDVNAPRHPLGKRGTFSGDQRREILAIVDRCGGVVRWGGTYSGRADEMHFEIVGNAGAVRNVAARLRGGGGAAAPAPSTGLLRIGSKGDRVRSLQRVLNAWYPWLNLAVDGDYGPATASAVKELQRRSRITVDGIAGPQTFGVLGM